MGKNYLKNKNQFKKTSLLGFTIVELLVVIVVIGILAAISVVSYSGIAQKARETALISDLTNAKTTLQMYQVENGSYPTSININDGCPIPADARFCLKPSTGINFSSYYNPGGDKQKFIIGATRDSVAGTVTDSTSPSISSVQSIPVAFTANGVGRNGSIQSWTVPTTGTYIIEAWGAQGGGGSNGNGGLGAYIKGSVNLSAGSVLKILVGQTPALENGATYGGYSSGVSGGGGGGTFITKNDNTPLIIAGGGGGYLRSETSSNQGINGQTSSYGANSLDNTGIGGYGGNGGNGSNNGWGGGGGGLNGNGTNSSECSDTGGAAFVNGGVGGGPCSNWPGFSSGGFGGGGGTHGNTGGGGGGGGYSGGGGSGQDTSPNFGGGGGSYNSGTNQTNSAGVNTGNGKVIITLAS